MGQTRLQRLRGLQKEIGSEYGYFGLDDLRKSVQEALRQPYPPQPGTVDRSRDMLREASQRHREQETAADQVARSHLPDVWVGDAQTRSGAAMSAIVNHVGRIADTLERAAQVLDRLRDALDDGRRLDDQGRDRLGHAAAMLDEIADLASYDSGQMKQAHHVAMAGIAAMVDGARHVERGSREATRELNSLSAKAHAARLKSSGLTYLNRVLVADAANPAGPHEANLILSADAASRAAARLDGLGGKDRTNFELLLSCSVNAEEQAYLLKALAAGYSMEQIMAFREKIHYNARDTLWLQTYLSPVGHAAPDGMRTHHVAGMIGETWTQGSEPTCVALSTVLARAQVDPIYAWQLTTGGPNPDVYPEQDGFAQRLHDEQHRVYDDGRNWLQDLFGIDGMTADQAKDAANKEVATHTGARYHEVSTHSMDDRRTVLPDVEKAVDQGLPVTFSVHEGRVGHEMAIIGHQGNMLEVYNPWGYTVWVSEDDFVNNRMNVIDDGVPRKVDAVNVPRH